MGIYIKAFLTTKVPIVKVRVSSERNFLTIHGKDEEISLCVIRVFINLKLHYL